MAMVKDVMYGKTLRKCYAKQNDVIEIPNLLRIQKDSYEWFLKEGFREVLHDMETISYYTGNLELSFLDFSMDDPPKYTVEQCKERDATYAKPIQVKVRLRTKKVDKDTGKEYRLAEALEPIRGKYSYVIIDTPPSAVVSDASQIARHCDGGIFVVQQDNARIDVLQEGMDMLSGTGVKMIGCILNGTQSGFAGSGYGRYGYGRYGGYGKKYGYGYVYGESKKE